MGCEMGLYFSFLGYLRAVVPPFPITRGICEERYGRYSACPIFGERFQLIFMLGEICV